jgi:hypothetical protein|tara:strand:- start:3047 stop:4009 length:963 start_codon:yes stop_codon:yes gene_type:complete
MSIFDGMAGKLNDKYAERNSERKKIEEEERKNAPDATTAEWMGQQANSAAHAVKDFARGFTYPLRVVGSDAMAVVPDVVEFAKEFSSTAVGNPVRPKSIEQAEQVVSADDTKQIKNFEEELKGMVRGSVSDPKKDSQLMEVVNSVGKGLTAGFEWTEGQWKNMTPNSKQALISSLASAYMLSKGYKGSAGNIARGGLEQMRYNDKVSTARGKLENDKKEKAAEAKAAYVKEKKSDLVATATNSAIKSIADSSLFIELTQVAGRIYGTNNMGEEDRIALANTLASEYRLQVQGGGITQGSFQDFASNPEVIKSVMQKYKTS